MTTLLNCEELSNKEGLSQLDRQLLNRVQSGFPICSEPFEQLARELSLEKSWLIERLQYLSDKGYIRRFGGVINHKKIGCSTLAALKVPEMEIQKVAELVNSYREINHNYLREHDYNMWFVVTAEDLSRLEIILEQLKQKTHCELLYLPMLKSHHINLAFQL